jgi:GT2 family glycosyltransferase
LIGIVVIGRNEGERLRACLASVACRGVPVVYADSGSTDGSVEAARDLGVPVRSLSADRPFSAARGRNEGAEALLADRPEVRMIQFVDGDCELVDGWLAAASGALAVDPDLGIVTGRLRERHRDRSIYNMMCDVEWDRPVGDILAFGGNMMVRREAFEAVGGFAVDVIAAEDDDFCIRVRKRGWAIRKIADDMMLHDAAMTSFRQWWTRATRAGHAFAQVGLVHPRYFARERRRVLFWGLGLPLAALAGAVASPWVVVGAIALYGASFAKAALSLSRRLTPRDAAVTAAFLTLSKFPNLQGMATFWARRLTGGAIRIIEHKQRYEGAR